MDDVDLFLGLEEGLWKASLSGDQTWLAETLSTDFTEYCRFGNVYDREHLIGSQANDVEVEFPFSDFTVERLSDDIVLVSYVNTVTFRGRTDRVRRTSIWNRPGGEWRLRLQQATTLPR